MAGRRRSSDPGLGSFAPWNWVVPVRHLGSVRKDWFWCLQKTRVGFLGAVIFVLGGETKRETFAIPGNHIPSMVDVPGIFPYIYCLVIVGFLVGEIYHETINATLVETTHQTSTILDRIPNLRRFDSNGFHSAGWVFFCKDKEKPHEIICEVQGFENAHVRTDMYIYI